MSLELSTPETEIPETPIEEAEDDVFEKRPPSGNKKRRRKRTKSTDK